MEEVYSDRSPGIIGLSRDGAESPKIFRIRYEEEGVGADYGFSFVVADSHSEVYESWGDG